MQRDILTAQFMARLEQRNAQDFAEKTIAFLRELPERFPSEPRIWREVATTLLGLVSQADRWSTFDRAKFFDLVVKETAAAEVDAVLLFYTQSLLLDMMQMTDVDAMSTVLERILRKCDQTKPQEGFVIGLKILTSRCDNRRAYAWQEYYTRDIFGRGSVGVLVKRFLAVLRDLGWDYLIWRGTYRGMVCKVLLRLPVQDLKSVMDELWKTEDVEDSCEWFLGLVEELARITKPTDYNKRLDGLYNDGIGQIVLHFIEWVVGNDGKRLFESVGEKSQWAHPVLGSRKVMSVEWGPDDFVRQYCLMGLMRKYPSIGLIFPDLLWGLVDEQMGGGSAMDAEDLVVEVLKSFQRVVYPLKSAMIGPEELVGLVGQRALGREKGEGVRIFGVGLVLGLARCLNIRVEEERVSFGLVDGVVRSSTD